jgi:hypothetical protein
MFMRLLRGPDPDLLRASTCLAGEGGGTCVGHIEAAGSTQLQRPKLVPGQWLPDFVATRRTRTLRLRAA